jgi:uncharacterized membrane protein YfcA
MTTLTIALLLICGLLIGVLGGLVGIGGGIVIVPLLVIAFGFEQVKANGTSLAVLTLPVLAFAAWRYTQDGNVNWPYALLLAVGYAGGAYAGAVLVNTGMVPRDVLRVLFGVLLLYVAGTFLFQQHTPAGAALRTSLIMAGFGVAWAVLRLFGRRLQREKSWADTYAQRVESRSAPEYQI